MRAAGQQRILFEQLRRHGVPKHLWEGISNWIFYGIEPGDFLRACFRNQFCEAALKADETNVDKLRNIASWLYWECPTGARGASANEWTGLWHHKNESNACVKS